MEMFEFLKYGFVQRALIAGLFIALLCSTQGVFLVLRRLSLIGDGLAHATFGTVALALLFKSSPLVVSLPLVMICSIGIMKITQKMRLYGDAAIGVISSLGIAGGVMISSLAGGFNVDLFSFLFGSILSISRLEVFIAIILSAAVILFLSFFYNEWLLITFDGESAKAAGINVKALDNVFAILTAITVVLSMKVVGIMLISSLLILPAVTALQLARSFRTTMLIAAVSALTSVLTGIIFSFYLDVPTGAAIVILNLVFFISAYFYKRISIIKNQY
ncbi:metal ABC transporter permease [Syntrophus aciditrophicus]|uniref:ABC-type Mn2+/Zn2+ transport systems, permease component n=1 Tax=Syntrophus aciditrophicus (strain SB) TaxID=56780 RepID=Q2LSM4_SYNAS|nr:metal ABC transporter permease [Syntrophus aciditrophicus]ABC77081.1 ABC-type Mn2+/Zn2+ transport systems, permease component [Syntrophus aciditrophicus SB]OPY18254.1 MAG: High-affinity zinc uptake system membrane protein ZnuB [Syntrophus sp. PtaB.Bin075]